MSQEMRLGALERKIEFLVQRVNTQATHIDILKSQIIALCEASKVAFNDAMYSQQQQAAHTCALVLVLGEAGLVDLEKVEARVKDINEAATVAGVALKPSTAPATPVQDMLKDLAAKLKSRGHG